MKPSAFSFHGQLRHSYGQIPVLTVAVAASFYLMVGGMAQACSSQTCGGLAINYPFGIAGSGCGHPDFQILCAKNISFGSGDFPLLPTPSGQLQILNISNDHLIANSTHIKAMAGLTEDTVSAELALPPQGPFTISGSNVFLATGCEFEGTFLLGFPVYVNGSHFHGWSVLLGGACTASCLQQKAPKYCNGVDCCQNMLPDNWKFIHLQGKSAHSFYPGGFSTILEPGTFADGKYGLKLDWAIGEENCSVSRKKPSYACSENSHCIEANRGSGYLCECRHGYSGDGYSNGTKCTDIDECATPGLNDCVPPPLGRCRNLPGAYNCSCAKGTGDGFQSGTRCTVAPTRASISTVSVLIGIFSTLIVGPLLGYVIYWIAKRRRTKALREKHFRQNGGLRLQEYMASDRGRKRANIFCAAELEKASDNFAEEQKLGSGGYGHVYKGTLPEGTLVAIKKCKEVGRHEIEQFVNEVIILSQIDHRNVVRLLGCCLETQAPLLVYEYVPNGTLYDHLQKKDGRFLSWENRIQIAIQAAEALSYLHSAASFPIIHRDVKSSNILLDSAGGCKLSDFGLSRSMKSGQSHLTTAVKGTLGYLDPQYFITIQLTDKSDVYSFGVVLVELLSSMKAVSTDRSKEDRNLTSFFLLRKQSGLLAEIFDSELIVAANGEPRDEVVESMRNVADLAQACLEAEAERRPSMKEVVQELLWMRDSRRLGGLHPWVSHSPGQSNGLETVNEESALIASRGSERAHPGTITEFTNSSASAPNVFDIEAMISLTAGR